MIGKKEDQPKDPSLDRLLRLSDISIAIDNYDDIFSDFDPRPYGQRALSDDFLTEAKKMMRDKNGGQLELHFLIPKKERNLAQEAIIKKRLHDHFKKHHDNLQKERKDVEKRGSRFVMAGIFIMFVASLVLYEFDRRQFLIGFLIILLEPAGWFLFWEGLSQIIFKAKEKKPDLEFYDRMARCEISFMPY